MRDVEGVRSVWRNRIGIVDKPCQLEDTRDSDQCWKTQFLFRNLSVVLDC